MANFRNPVAARIHADRYDSKPVKRLTALGQIADRCTTSLNAANRAVANKDYHTGKAAAYNDAYAIMKAELQRLRNLLQNGSLTQADFGDDLPY